MAWKDGDQEGKGTVFCIGDGKTGVRIGVEDVESGESKWFDVRQLTVIDEPAPKADEPDDIPF